VSHAPGATAPAPAPLPEDPTESAHLPVGSPVLPALTTATARMARVMFLATGVTAVVFSTLAVGKIMVQATIMNPVWFTATTVTLWLIPVALLVLCGWAPLSWLRRLAVAYVLVYCLTVATWMPAMQAPAISDGEIPWVQQLVSVPIFAAALVWRESVAWVCLVGICLEVGILRFFSGGALDWSPAIQDTVYNFTSVTVFIAIVLMVLRSGRTLDATAAAATRQTSAAAAADAHRVQRARVAALTHDDVLSALLSGARTPDDDFALVQRHAARTLERLDALTADEVDEGQDLPAAEFIAVLRDTVSHIVEGVRFDAPATPTGLVPRDIAQALIEATGEAVRNSVRHAAGGTDRTHHSPANMGRTVARSLRLTMSPTLVSVAIVDDGVGFSSRMLHAERFGIRIGIVQRMSLVPGGHGEVRSVPGQGTSVLVQWRAPEDPDAL